MDPRTLLTEILGVTWLAFPVMFAAATHLAVIRLDLLPALQVPLDGERSWGSHRILGNHKTVRGALVMIGASTAGMVLQGQWRFPSLELFDYGSVHRPLAGFLLGLGFVLGELPNSFLKRRRNIPPGAPGGFHFTVLDQVDSVLGCLALLGPVWMAPPRVWLLALVLGSLMHMAFNLLFVRLGLKERVL